MTIIIRYSFHFESSNISLDPPCLKIFAAAEQKHEYFDRHPRHCQFKSIMSKKSQKAVKTNNTIVIRDTVTVGRNQSCQIIIEWLALHRSPESLHPRRTNAATTLWITLIHFRHNFFRVTHLADPPCRPSTAISTIIWFGSAPSSLAPPPLPTTRTRTTTTMLFCRCLPRYQQQQQ